MFGNLQTVDRLRQIITGRRSSDTGPGKNSYLEAGCTQSERRGMNLLKEWLSPETIWRNRMLSVF